jgi:ribosome-associated translation inhibitor RaiA
VKETMAEKSASPAASPSIRFPYDISFADSDTSPATSEKIESYLARLDRHYDRITDAKVFVRIPHNHGPKLFHIHIQLDIPGKRLAVSRDTEVDDSHAAIQTAIKDAFQKITRQLDDFVKLRNEHKPH